MVVEAARVEGVEADVDPVEARRRRSGRRSAGQAERVGGDARARVAAERAGTRATMSTQPAAEQRLAAGEPDLADAEALHGDRDQPDDLVVGEHLGVGQPVEALGRHAVGAAQVAPVGQRDPQVGRHAAVRVGRVAACHSPSLGAAGARMPSTVRRIASSGTVGRAAVPASADAGSLFAARRRAARPTRCLLLGRWQLHRLHERKAANSRDQRTNLSRRARARSTSVLAASGADPAATRASGAVVTATGTYDAAHDGRSSATRPARARPASTSSTRWSPTPGTAAAGRPRLDGHGQPGRRRRRGSRPRRRAGHRHRLGPRGRRPAARPRSSTARPGPISSAQIGPAIGHPACYGGFVDLQTESPGAATPLARRRAARPRQRTALLLRPAVVVLRAARGRSASATCAGRARPASRTDAGAGGPAKAVPTVAAGGPAQRARMHARRRQHRAGLDDAAA